MLTCTRKSLSDICTTTAGENAIIETQKYTGTFGYGGNIRINSDLNACQNQIDVCRPEIYMGLLIFTL